MKNTICVANATKGKRNMLRKIISLFTVLPIAACTVGAAGGSYYESGQTTRGEPVIGTATNLGSGVRISVSGNNGWVCSSTFADAGKVKSAERQSGLSCSDGRSGKMIVTGNREKELITAEFDAGKSRRGKIVFSNKSKTTPYEAAINAGKTFLITYSDTGYPNSAAGVDAYINVVNLSSKNIKYIKYQVTPYNAVGDVQRGTVRRRSISKLSDTGPYGPQTKIPGTWENVWYNSTITCMVINSVRIEYMDGSVKSYPNTRSVQSVMAPGLQNTCKV